MNVLNASKSWEKSDKRVESWKWNGKAKKVEGEISSISVVGSVAIVVVHVLVGIKTCESDHMYVYCYVNISAHLPSSQIFFLNEFLDDYKFHPHQTSKTS